MKNVPLFSLASYCLALIASITLFLTSGMAATGTSRGYVTTPTELTAIAKKATEGMQPYRDAVLSVKNYANTDSSAVQFTYANPTFWPYGTISGPQVCIGNQSPPFLTKGATLVEAKAMVYELLLSTQPNLANQYAADVRTEVLQLVTNLIYDGPLFSGKNQCILNLSWSTPSWVIAADLIEGYPG